MNEASRMGSFGMMDPARSLFEREAEMRLITELLPVYILRCDAQLRYKFVNPAYARRFGKEPEELTGKTIQEVIGEAAYDVTRPHLERLLAGEPVQYEATIPYPGLGPRFVRSTNVPEFDVHGHVIGFVGALIDLSDRKQAEEALRESEERFRTLADNMSQLAWMADKKGWVFWYNQRWYDFTGTTLSQMQGEGWKAVHHPDHVDRVVERIHQSWDTGEVWEDTFPLRGKNGQYRWFLSRALPVRDANGSIVRWFGTNTDVTEQRAAEQALKEADRRKDEFLAVLSHELRNPLAPLRHGLEIQRLAGSDMRLAEKARSMMERQVIHLVRLVDDLLDISRITCGKLELKCARIELQQTIRGAVETVEPLLRAARHELRLNLPNDPIMVSADVVRLTQVFTNLLNNAVRYTPPGGHVSIEATAHGDEVAVTVTDDGVGIPAHMLERVFDPFMQARRAGESTQGGLGLGLSLARSFVMLHGGTIQAQSGGDGCGSCIVVRLPTSSGGADEAGNDDVRSRPQHR